MSSLQFRKEKYHVTSSKILNFLRFSKVWENYLTLDFPHCKKREIYLEKVFRKYLPILTCINKAGFFCIFLLSFLNQILFHKSFTPLRPLERVFYLLTVSTGQPKKPSVLFICVACLLYRCVIVSKALGPTSWNSFYGIVLLNRTNCFLRTRNMDIPL